MDEKKLVVKSNKLNQARYHLTVQEQRLILSLISNIEPGDNVLQVHRLSVQQFKDLVGLSGESSYSQLKSITKRLLSKVLVIDEPDGELQAHWVDHVKYYDDEGYLDLSFSLKLKPYLLALKKEFTRYQLKNVIRLKSGYSVRIYELLKQYQSIGTRYFDLQDLRRILCIPDKKLARYTDFRRYVLEVAKKELMSSDICFDYVAKKHVRKVVGIVFLIFPNEEIIKESKKPKSKKKALKETQLDFEFEKTKIRTENERFSLFASQYPKEFKKLKKMAGLKLSKAEKRAPGFNLTLKFKMKELFDDFLKKEGIFI